MAKKKKQSATSPEAADGVNGTEPLSTAPPVTASAAVSATASATVSATASSTKKVSASSSSSSARPAAPALIICRNKHWRYISSFHGPWLQLPHEILETLASVNYNHPRPRPIDPAVFFDLVKIRRLVDEATSFAVRAASGIISSSTTPQHPGALALGIGIGQPNRSLKLSAERRHRLRMDATQKLSQAYHIDEIATSVATMQGASTLEDVAGLVLERNPQDPDANYVHFFHEKIPSRQLAECTSQESLDLVIAERPAESEPLRTRAAVRVFQGDLEGAAADLSDALRLARFYNAATYEHERRVGVVEKPSNRQISDAKLDEDKQPSSLEIQLLFERADVYLALASRHIKDALPENAKAKGSKHKETAQGIPPNRAPPVASESPESDEGPAAEGILAVPELTAAEKGAQKKQFEARKAVRAYAKRAVRDFMAFFAYFDYTPDLPVEVAENYARSMSQSARAYYRSQGYQTSYQPYQAAHPESPTARPAPAADGAATTQKIYTLNELFSSTPPADLPPYPSDELVALVADEHKAHLQRPSPTAESVTYHPLMADALHSLLLAHAILQTSPKELLRHAYMVARLARLADGYPVFQVSRSPARADWVEVLRRSGRDEWVRLATGWESLCTPAPMTASLKAATLHGTKHLHIQKPKSMPSPYTSAEARAMAAATATGSGVGPGAAAVPVNGAEREQGNMETLLASSRTARRHPAGRDPTAVGSSPKVSPAAAATLPADYEIYLDPYRTVVSPSKLAAALDATKAKGPGAKGPGAKGPGAKGPGAVPLPLRQGTKSNSSSLGSGAPAPATASKVADRQRGSSKRWGVDDPGRDHPVLTERAAAISRWVRAGVGGGIIGGGEGGGSGGQGGGARRKKKNSKTAAGTVSSAASSSTAIRQTLAEGGEDEAGAATA